MPDQDRGVRFLPTLNQDLGAGVRCPSCPGYRVTYQADCVCCGREVADPDSKADSVKAASLSVKPELFEAAMPKSASQGVPAESQALKGPRTCKGRQRLSPIPGLRNVSSFHRPSAGRESGIGSRGLLRPAGGSRNSVRILQQSTHNAVRSSSVRRGTYATRGRPAVRVGAHQDFKGVRTRRGVKGFLVEIRPPKWKKTIWLGTYNTDVEAAGAFDAGVFYTNKPNTKYNFRVLEAAFPPLPSHLRLDQPDNMEEIKYFVQKQAKLAAAAARRMCNATNISGATQPHHQELQVEVKPSILASADRATASVNDLSTSESCLTDDSVSGSAETDLPTTPDAEYDGGFLDIIPMDLDYLRGGVPAVDEEAAENWIAEYTNYLNTQPGGPMS